MPPFLFEEVLSFGEFDERGFDEVNVAASRILKAVFIIFDVFADFLKIGNFFQIALCYADFGSEDIVARIGRDEIIDLVFILEGLLECLEGGLAAVYGCRMVLRDDVGRGT